MFYGILLTDKGQGVGERIPITRGRALPITLTAWAQVQGKVFTSGGRIVRNFSVINPTATKGAPDYYAVPPGDHMIIWEGRNDSGELVAPGDYYTMLETRTLQAPATIQVRPEQNNGTRQRVTRTRTQDDTIFDPQATKERVVTRTKRRGESGRIPKPGAQATTTKGQWQTATGQWERYGDTQHTPTGKAAGLTPMEDMVRKGADIDTASQVTGDPLEDLIKGIPRGLLTPCATELIRKQLISVNSAYDVCADNYLAMQADELARLTQGDGAPPKDEGLLKNPWVLGVAGVAVALLMGG
jgi:hypothetical protein